MPIATSYLMILLSCATPGTLGVLDPKALDDSVLEKWGQRVYSASVKGDRGDERISFGRMVLTTTVAKDSIELVDTSEIGPPGLKPAIVKSRLVFSRDNFLSPRALDIQFLISLPPETLDHRVLGKKANGKILLETKPEPTLPGRDLPNDLLLPESLIRVAAMLAKDGPKAVSVPLYVESVSLYSFATGMYTQEQTFQRREIHVGKVTPLKVAGKVIECTPVEIRELQKVVTPAKVDEYEADKEEMMMVSKARLWISPDQSVVRFEIGSVRFDLETPADR